MRPRLEAIEKIWFHETYRPAAEGDVRPGPTRLLPADREVVDRLEPLAGRRVLDLGAGDGALSVELVRRGAQVVALDLASTALVLAGRRAAVDRVRFGRVCGSVHRLPFGDGSFDRIAGGLVLHHLDLSLAAPEVRRVLAPGGRAAFRETFDANPILRACRRWVAGRCGVARVGTPTERPLGTRELAILRQVFGGVRLVHPEFVFFRLLDRHVFRYRSPRVHRWLLGLDEAVHRRVPRLARFSYQSIVLLDP